MSKRTVTMTLCALLCLLAPRVPAEGSRMQINRPLDRPEGWTRIVAQSPFALGELSPAGEVSGVPVYTRTYGTYPSLDGSTVALPLALEFARQHLNLSDSDIESFVFFSTTPYAYENLIRKAPGAASLLPSQNAAMDAAHPVDLILATAPSDAETAMAAEAGVTLVKEPVCLDAFVFITHRDNPVENLSLDQIRRIYAGEINNWRQVGGSSAPIVAYQREANSGSQTTMEQLVMKGEALSGAEPHYVTSGMDGLVRRVGDYENAQSSLGYTFLYYIDALYTGEPIKTIAIDGVAPTAENIRSGAYPLSAAYYGVYRQGEENGPAGQFLHWILSEEGQRCVAQAGYIPVR